MGLVQLTVKAIGDIFYFDSGSSHPSFRAEGPVVITGLMLPAGHSRLPNATGETAVGRFGRGRPAVGASRGPSVKEMGYVDVASHPQVSAHCFGQSVLRRSPQNFRRSSTLPA